MLLFSYICNMKRIGLLSDTHGYWDDRFQKYFAECDEIWHAGDIGTTELADRLATMPIREGQDGYKVFRAVYGNIDGGDLRLMFNDKNRFRCEEVDVLIKHIGGYPGNYDRSINAALHARPPKLFISGHSHILKVMYDQHLGLLHINPGAAGIYGFHKTRTLVRFTIDGSEIKDLEVIELSDKSDK